MARLTKEQILDIKSIIVHTAGAEYNLEKIRPLLMVVNTLGYDVKPVFGVNGGFDTVIIAPLGEI